MPRKISTWREITYLRALAETANATLAAARAGVSRDWAYKRRLADALFDGRCREMVLAARARLPVQVRRDRAGGWTAELEARFIERLRETCSVWLACAEVGLSTVSAYRHRQRRPGFAAAWEAAEREGWPPGDEPWIASAICFLEGEPVPPDNPVRFTRVGEVIQALRGNRCVARPPRGR